MNKINNLYKYLPNDKIDWDLINKDLLYPFIKQMKETMQEPAWHAEGDVYTHTTMVVSKLIELNSYKELSEVEKLIVFLSAVFHDIAKHVCTKI